MMTKYRFLQTVIRESEEPIGPASYRYDLLAHCYPEDPYFIIRAHRFSKEPGGIILNEDAAVVGPIYARESNMSEVFLDIAHADDPLHPTHLPDILEDFAAAAPVDIDFMQTEGSLAEYYHYDEEDASDFPQSLYGAEESIEFPRWHPYNNH